MEEARRFLRYVIPGLVLIIEVSFYLWLIDHKQFIELIKELKEISENGIGLPISVFLASGGIGFILGVIYRVLSRFFGLRELFMINHQPLIVDAVERDWLELQRRENGINVDPIMISQDGAWRIVTSFWHERRESSVIIKGANPRVDTLTDIMHGLGTMAVGSIVAFFVLLYICICIKGCFYFCGYCPNSTILAIIIALFLLIAHIFNFYRVVKDVQSVIDMIMTDELQKQSLLGNTPIVINVAHIDLR